MQVPCGAGLAFACKYNAKPGEAMNVAIAAYGVGAANQVNYVRACVRIQISRASVRVFY